MTSPQDPRAERDAGLLTQAAGAWTYAWTGVRIDAAADLTEAEQFRSLNQDERLDMVAAADRAWVGGLWEQAHLERYDLRYLSDPATGRIGCTVLGRVAAVGGEAALPAALGLRRHLARTLPQHVHAVELTDAAQVGAALSPFAPHPRGVVEIRKRIWSGIPQRPDANMPYYFMIQPFTVTPASWEPVLRALAAQPAPVLLSVGLIPAETGQDAINAFHQLATVYDRLASAGEIPENIFTARMQLTADAFAVDAHEVFADAARRYAGRVFKLRITLASPAPIPDGLGELVGRAISPSTTAGSSGHGGGVLAESFSGPAYRMVRPADEQELAAAWHNVAAIEHLRWDRDYYRDQPTAPQPLLRSLCELVDPGEAVAALRLPAAITGALPGIAVRRPAAAGLIEYEFGDGHVALGEQLSEGRAAGRLGIAVEDLTRHALFVGAPGSGKTNSTLAFCEQLWREHRIPFLVIEPVNAELDDYRWLATRPGFEDLLVLTVGDERTAPLRLNPFEAPPGVSVQAHMGGLKSCFDAAFGLWDPLPAIYDRALLALYRSRGIVPSERSSARYAGRWPRLAEFSDCLAEEVAKLGYQGEVRANIEAAAQLRAQSLAYGACAATLDCASSFPVAALLDRPVVVELAALGDNEREQTLVTALLLSALTEYYKANREPASGTRHVMVIEEAHRLLGRPAGASSGGKDGDAQAAAAARFANTLAENRKYGEGVVVVEQVPGKLIEDAYKNSNLKVMHRLPAEDDRKTIGATMRFNPDQERQAAALAPFSGYVYHDRLDRPVLVQVPDVRGEAARAEGLRRAPLAGAPALRARFERFIQEIPDADAALTTFPDCTGCAHRCFYRGNAEPVATASAAEELDRRVTEFRTLPKAERKDWWAQTLGWLGRAAADTAPAELPDVLEPDSERLADYEACVVVHLGRRLEWTHTAAWAQQVRERWPEFAQAQRAAGAAAAHEAEPDFSDE
ncbi:ATP-binding protein [Actinospica durhamensis]|uniref:ATP-binding protein n=1 Tax=Actinospica durhamensis TaxID=1508375 RepID=A0A941IRM1_9ACTN|nr:ATP-binding protein [Actinospica durhamensis]MBR7838950.1 ATP-binding protein [Actinospica durhamensis]